MTVSEVRMWAGRGAEEEEVARWQVEPWLVSVYVANRCCISSGKMSEK